MRVVRARTVFDNVGIDEMRCVEVRQRTVMSKFNRSLGGVVDDRVQVGKLEVIGRRPVSNLVRR